MNRAIPISLAILATACGGAATGPATAAPAPGNDAAPGWAGRGDAQDGQGHRFICEGQGSTEEQALSTARAICDDKICKLCGVEIESVVETSETLTGVEMQRKVVERCRRVRQGESELARKSVDCGPTGCFAWIQIDYADKRREQECRRLTDENFADPGVCQALIEEFKTVEGHTAASFRQRVRILEDAKGACAEIDVRPTPLMQSLDEKLKIGMGTFRVGAPRHLAGHWLADYPPMWDQFKQSPQFIERLEILLGYLRHKVPLLDVIEAVDIEDEALDSKEGMQRLLSTMKVATRQEAYGVRDIHMVAAHRLDGQADRGRITVDTETLNLLLRSTYPPAELREWGDVVSMTGVFEIDGVIDRDEWDYARQIERWRPRAMQMLLEMPRHQGATRLERFGETLEVAVAKSKGKLDRAFENAMPSHQPEFLLEVEPHLPAEVRKALTWEMLAKHMPDHDDLVSDALRERFVKRLHRSLTETKLASMPDDRARSFCLGLYQRLETLEQHRGPTGGLEALLCACLTGPLAGDGTLNSANKSPLYDRALALEATCVRPH